MAKRIPAELVAALKSPETRVISARKAGKTLAAERALAKTAGIDPLHLAPGFAPPPLVETKTVNVPRFAKESIDASMFHPNATFGDFLLGVLAVWPDLLKGLTVVSDSWDGVVFPDHEAAYRQIIKKLGCKAPAVASSPSLRVPFLYVEIKKWLDKRAATDVDKLAAPMNTIMAKYPESGSW